MLKTEGMELNHIKTHGYLWRLCETSNDHCRAVMEAIKLFDVPALVITNSRMEKMATEMEIPLIQEFYPDLNYNEKGLIMSMV